MEKQSAVTEVKLMIDKSTHEAVAAAENALLVAKSLVITTPDQLDYAAVQLKAVKAKYNELEATRKSMTAPIDQAKKRIMDFFRAPLGFLEDAERILKNAIATYQREQEIARQKLEAQMQERQRKEREKLEQRAENAEAKGQTEKAAALRDTAASVPTPVLAPMSAPAGVSTRDNWKAEVFDKAMLLAAVLDGVVPGEAILINEQYLNARARVDKAGLKIPGVKAVNSVVVSSRA